MAPITSPFKGSGHGGSKSPRKNDRVQMLDIHTAKLRSPMKRSMSELNRLAYENAKKSKPQLLNDDADDIDINELSVLQKIIRLSEYDDSITMPMEEDEPDIIHVKQETVEEPTKVKIEYIDEPLSPLKSTIIKSSPLKREIKLSPSETPALTPTNSPLKSEIKSVLSNVFESPVRRSGRKRVNLLSQLENASTESSPSSTPRKRRNRNLHSTFNGMDDLKPINHQKIKLMEIPKVENEDDELLAKESTQKNQVMYHDGFEAYFEQNHRKFRASKCSMTQAPDLTYEEFNKYNNILDLICSEPIESLNKFYKFHFSQWLFELNENFNLIFYGVGSKRTLLIEFLKRFVLPTNPQAKCIVINGYNTEFTLRMLLREIWRVCFNKTIPTAREIREACNFTHLEFIKPRNKNKKLYILLNNIDGHPLRNADVQSMLSEIARIDQISLICSTDNLITPVFWDASVLSNYNFIWHNVSTFKSYTTEVSFQDPLSIGKTDELVGSRGAKYVLSSLTGNAKNLYKNLILQQLEQIDVLIGDDSKLIDNRGNTKGSIKSCIPLREFYDLCVGEFIISNDISFRTILGEFVEHKMCTLTRDTSGMEVLYIAFSVDELEKILDEELVD